jgi:hypothetical protein
MYPTVKPESVRQGKAVWCSRDRVKAWNDLTTGLAPASRIPVHILLRRYLS